MASWRASVSSHGGLSLHRHSLGFRGSDNVHVTSVPGICRDQAHPHAFHAAKAWSQRKANCKDKNATTWQREGQRADCPEDGTVPQGGCAAAPPGEA